MTVTPSEIDDSMPTEDEIAEVVKKLRKPQRWHVAVQFNPLLCDLLERISSGRRSSVHCSLVPPLHPPPRLLRVWWISSQ